MKKVFVLLACLFIISGCGKTNKDTLSGFINHNTKYESYELTGKMMIISGEDEFSYDLNVLVSNQKYYRVSLKNSINNNEQIILKNKEGVFVVSPKLNKSFKFQSEWPNSSSQAYLIESIIKDINNDEKTSIEMVDDNYIIKTKVNYPNNIKFVTQVITTDKKYNIKCIEVKDSENNTLLKVDVSKIAKTSVDENEFDLDKYVSEKCEDCETETTSSILDNIIYPLYVPTDTYLSTKDTVNTENGERVILTFAGVEPFILIEEPTSRNEEMEIIPVNGEPLILYNTVAALSDNSLYWNSGGYDFYITSKTLDSTEMLTIAESIQNSNSLVASTK